MMLLTMPLEAGRTHVIDHSTRLLGHRVLHQPDMHIFADDKLCRP